MAVSISACFFFSYLYASFFKHYCVERGLAGPRYTLLGLMHPYILQFTQQLEEFTLFSSHIPLWMLRTPSL